MGVLLQQLQQSSSLLLQHKMGAMTAQRAYNTAKKLAQRRRRLEIKKMAMTPCYMALRRSENRCNQPRLKLPLAECIDDPCGEMELPTDLDHYTPSDKATREYQRTWCECYPIPKAAVQAKKCYPNRPRRKFGCIHATEVICRDEDMNPVNFRLKPEKLIEVPRIGEWPCCKISAPGCPPGRRPPSCDVGRIPSCCKKRRTQYPSFSECIQVGLLDPIPWCECEKKVNLCDVWAYWRRKNKS
ncbi:uncharacterized protein LOC108086776 [Drosophila ficusphila]|uniref:uncharacterized protein LOC108086776 n=1 Tax=Drosophila ficusphila TaxID=30025 RepID=UPI0007E6C5DC|nr:uncharacterized protein LOC108086776 [Drosophila ficusphila]